MGSIKCSEIQTNEVLQELWQGPGYVSKGIHKAISGLKAKTKEYEFVFWTADGCPEIFYLSDDTIAISKNVDDLIEWHWAKNGGPSQTILFSFSVNYTRDVVNLFNFRAHDS